VRADNRIRRPDQQSCRRRPAGDDHRTCALGWSSSWSRD